MTTHWLVGAAHSANDQTERFLSDGIWENGYRDQLLDLVRSMATGDKIAIKSSYTRKLNLPFDNRGHTVSVMKVKAIGTITRNHGDGRHIDVDWQTDYQEREWYFYTGWKTVWKLDPEKWENQALIDFAFNGVDQDIDRFRNEPKWRERFGDTLEQNQRFEWTRFYTAMATALLEHKEDRSQLIAHIHDMGTRHDCMAVLNDKSSSGERFPLRDICPYTTFGIFNRGLTYENRTLIATELAKFLGVEEDVPTTFEGIPVLNNQKSWYFSYEASRQPRDIDDLWQIFATGIALADGDDNEDLKAAFIREYDQAQSCRGVSWNLTIGLYWTRPWDYAPLDTRSRSYLSEHLGETVAHDGPNRQCMGDSYLKLVERLSDAFSRDDCPVHSFPDLSLAACNTPQANDESGDDGEQSGQLDPGIATPQATSYTIEDIVADGCFVPQDRLEQILSRLKERKNIILQGPPGTGKTWLAKRIAYAAMQAKAPSRIKAIQFHPNLSYEDFVRGYRPSTDGRLQLVDGPFLEMVDLAHSDPDQIYALVIEEINRGNPAQVFGEMLTLLEHDKRYPDEALALSYAKSREERVYIPRNLVVIGTMNIADRSLALVDLALRRRFAFIDLEPTFGQPWQEWMQNKTDMPLNVIIDIEQRIVALNQAITDSVSLGRQFKIGHSYVTPGRGLKVTDHVRWFRDIVMTEIGPLLEEYWFDDIGCAHTQRDTLLEGWTE